MDVPCTCFIIIGTYIINTPDYYFADPVPDLPSYLTNVSEKLVKPVFQFCTKYISDYIRDYSDVKGLCISFVG